MCCTIPIPISNKHIQRPQVTKNMGTRICMGMLRSTPIAVLNIEANTPPVQLYITKHKLNYMARLIHRGNTLAAKIKQHSVADLSKIYHEFSELY